LNGVRVVAGRRWGVPLRAALAAGPQGTVPWMQRHTQLLKVAAGGSVGALDVAGSTCVLKFYPAPTPLARLRMHLRCSRAQRAFRAGRALAARGLPVARPLSCLRVPEGELVLSAALPAGRTLDVLWAAAPGSPEAARMLAGAGASLAALHAQGYRHGDCKWSNLLWDGDTCFLLDLDATGRRRLRPRCERARDVARFTVNAEEVGVDAAGYEVFLDSYLRAGGGRRERLLADLQPALARLRGRHLARYGTRARPLA